MSWDELPILVAEDSDDDFFLLDRAFRKAGIVNLVRRVDDGQQVISYLEGLAPYSDRETYPFPYLLLLDLKLPLKHGFDVLRWIRRAEKTIALLVVVFSSSRQPEDIHLSYTLGANGFVAKATSLEELIKVVAAMKAYWLQVNCGSPKVR